MFAMRSWFPQQVYAITFLFYIPLLNVKQQLVLFYFLYETLATSISELCIGWYYWSAISLQNSIYVL